MYGSMVSGSSHSEEQSECTDEATDAGIGVAIEEETREFELASEKQTDAVSICAYVAVNSDGPARW